MLVRIRALMRVRRYQQQRSFESRLGDGALTVRSWGFAPLPSRRFTHPSTPFRALLPIALMTCAACGGGAGGGNDSSQPSASADTIPPLVHIVSPTTAGTFATTAPQLSFSGTATDVTGVTTVTWTNDRGGSGAAVGTDTWTIAGMPLSVGANLITVVARDATGNSGTDKLTVEYSLDTTPPRVQHWTPVSNATVQPLSVVPTITFSEQMDPSTINAATVLILDASHNIVSATVAYDAATRTASIAPVGSLSYQSPYTVSVIGSATEPRAKDVAGNALAATFTSAFTTIVATGACDSNAITAENCLAGNPASEWDVIGAGDATIQGFATDISVNRGNTISFKVNTSASSYRLDIYRMGYYGGLGARKIATVLPSATLPQSQPSCLTVPSTGLIDCGNWAVSASWSVPSNGVSGIYFAKLVRTDTNGASHIFFVVRDDSSTSDLFFQTSDTTWQAYNTYGGNSLYEGFPVGRAYKVSYNRPFATRGAADGKDFVFNAEYPAVRWLEANGYDVSYTTGIDSDRRGNLIRNHRVFLSVGHDEYWSAAQRTNVETARNNGVDLAFFSGNEVFWKTRWENSIDGSSTAYRTLVCYKETHADAKIDPTSTWTGTWRDPRFSPPSDGNRPENALTGTMFMVNNGATTSMDVPEADGKMRFWRNTSVATLSPGQQATLPNGVLGFEWDMDIENSVRPPGLIRLSRTTRTNVPLLQDQGSTYAPGPATHSLTLYKHASGALVFGAGTIQWSWGLDANHDRAGTPSDIRMQQATVNLFADMGVQPAALQAGLTAATASTDTSTPTTAFVSPGSGATINAGTVATVTGTAADVGGGAVAAVEYSLDNGVTWHSATGRSNWSFPWQPNVVGQATLRARAIDDSGNFNATGTSIVVNVIPAGSGSCPCSIWNQFTVPGTASHTDTGSVSLGVKFRSSSAGQITGIRFYKGPANTGTHTAHLWSASGTPLASATFVNETASGWQTVLFSSPIPISANTTYVASYFAPQGGYARDAAYFAGTGVTNGALTAPGTAAVGGNGVYVYGSTALFPTNTYDATNYWVDVLFATQ
jgi:hypothetical protein